MLAKYAADCPLQHLPPPPPPLRLPSHHDHAHYRTTHSRSTDDLYLLDVRYPLVAISVLFLPLLDCLCRAPFAQTPGVPSIVFRKYDCARRTEDIYVSGPLSDVCQSRGNIEHSVIWGTTRWEEGKRELVIEKEDNRKHGPSLNHQY